MRIILALLLTIWGAAPSFADFRIIGRASLFNNDYFGDGDDRWRSGSYTRSTFFGPVWNGRLPDKGVFELRFRGEVIAPTDLSKPPEAGERPFVGVVAAGIARHFSLQGADMHLGADIVAIGPQTGVSSFVTEAHDLLGFKTTRATSGELANDLIPTVHFAASRLIHGSVSEAFQLRPFVEAQVGVEHYARIGMDAFFGQGATGDLLTRDVVTGHMMTVVSMHETVGFTPTLGADFTRVFDSAYLPGSSGLALKKWRMRVRGGVRRLGQSQDVFLGLTWLSPEYEGQPGGQVLGSLSIDQHF